ncbi:MAG: hypothetical protein K2X61_02870 [Caulobacteraceae bacterium]|nr:hypothetical protein [Caulobacteraceae bacterium]
MAQAVENPEQITVASGTTDVFATVWTFEDDSEVEVSVDAGDGYVVKTAGVHYDVSAGDWLNDGADVVFRAGQRPAAGHKVLRRRRTPRKQEVAFGDTSRFQPTASEAAYDRQTRMIQELTAEVGRAVVVPPGATPPTIEDLELAAEAGAAVAEALETAQQAVETAESRAAPDLSNVSDEDLSNKQIQAERTRGAGFYNVLRLTSDDIDVTGASDMATILNGFLAEAQAADKWLQLPGGYPSIKLGSSLLAYHGRNSGGAAVAKFRMDLNGAVLKPQMADFAIKVIPLCATANAGLGYGIADLGLEDGQIDLAANAGAKAILLGRSGYVLDGFKYEDLIGLLVTGASVGGTIELRGNVRHLDLVDIVQRDDGGMLLNATDENGFIGDIQMKSLQLSGTTARRPLELRTAAFGAQIRGLTMSGDIYGAGTKFQNGPAGFIGDLWLTDFQFEGPRGGALPAVGAVALELFGDSESRFFDIFFNNPYFKGFRGRALLYQLSGGSGTNIQINGGVTSEIAFTDTNAGAMLCVGAQGLHLRGHQFRDIENAYPVNWISSTDMSAIGCRLSRRAGNVVAAPTGFVVVGGAGMTRYVIRDTIAEVASGLDADVVNDYTSGVVARIVKDNVSSNFGGSNAAIPTITAADPLVLPPEVDAVFVSGNTPFGQVAGLTKDRPEITLHFLGTPSVFSSNAGGYNDVRLKGNQTFIAGPGASLTIRHNGTQGIEQGRSDAKAYPATVTVASADPLPVPAGARAVIVTGTTSFGAIAGWEDGRDLDLFFEGVLTVFDGTGSSANVRMDNNANFTTRAGSSLSLRGRPTQWGERSRAF